MSSDNPVGWHAAIEEGGQVLDRFHPHRHAGFLGGAVKMRQQHDVFELLEPVRNLRLGGIDVEPGAADGSAFKRRASSVTAARH